MSNIEEAPHKKRKVEASLESLLPDDVAISCLARVSRLEYAALSLASKSYRSLVSSPELYKTRSLMGRTETYVYVCLRTPPDSNPRWYILRRREILNASFSDLMPIPSCPSQPPEASSVVVLDWGIYVIGGLIKGKPTSKVLLLDCRTHTWRQVPSMRVTRASAAAGVVDGKIYVLGGCKFDEKNWGEVFDPKTQTWDTLPPMPDTKKRDQYIHDSLVRDQKVYAVDGTDRTLYYSPSLGQWGRGNRGEVIGNRRDWCMIDNLIFFLTRNGTVIWCEPDELDWRETEGMVSKEVKGLGFLKKSLSCSRLVHFGEQIVNLWEKYKIKFGRPQKLIDLLPGARLSNSGGNIVLFWDVIEGDHLEIWCAEISLERRQGGEIWGNIEWSNAVMTVDPFLDRSKALSSI
ncbi:Kelch repeat type 1 [Arabidopsis thaliana x Arabidopsis arenosa]|uniref:Kelch repeat type 1 n=1 Tax=Arabidopsis thaliana x Arabidopsis arenosa TaxID=1240361 RepID=A0A8T1XY26_9BRAS|nr:Kelch repeat type 1 [Arabidopsis thaliana x Arabidopsis arenosa]KAG7539984.1 Kelch repeat type 1 [Arabidopsis thaliana x Arabidopsis arenosa]